MAKAQPIRNVDCSGPALIGITAVLRQRFEEMISYRQHALNPKDVEGVHAMRVASRRLRSCMRDFMPYLGKRRLVSPEKRIRRIADALGEARDQDVAILALEKLESSTSPPFSTTLRELVVTRNEIRRVAHQKLKQILMKQELNDLQAQFAEALAAATIPKPSFVKGSTANFSYDEMAATVIRARLMELERSSVSLYNPFESKPLHEMRVAAKRLRYAVELFQQCFDRELGPFAKMSGRLQTALGEVHDCDVWISSLGKELSKTRGRELDQRQSLSWLLSHFANIRNRRFQTSLKLWQRWENKDLSTKLKAALKS